MTKAPPDDYLQQLAIAFRDNGIRAVLVGGFCLPVHGVERMTLDIDFMIAASQREQAGAALESVGWARVFRNDVRQRLIEEGL